MKILTWNCNGALRKKLFALEQFDADILIIQECEDPTQSTEAYRNWAGDYIWKGKNKNKGIGIFPKKQHRVKNLNWTGEFFLSGLHSTSPSLKWRSEDLQLFVPFSINGKITILAVWTKGREDQAFGYMGQFWKYLQIHRSDLASGTTVILGDFNSNAQWDKPDRWWSHSDTIVELQKIGLESAYHMQTGETQGRESKPTFFLQRNEGKPYHIDYTFLSSDLLESANLHVGNYQEWIKLSDHVPLLLEIHTQ